MEVQVVYLDQNAACFLAKPNPEPIWGNIREALIDGFQKRKLICPLPFESVMESAPLPLAVRQDVQALFLQLSGGMEFKAFTEISNELTLALIRPVPNWSFWRIRKPSWAELEKVANRISSDWEAGKNRMMARMNGFVRSPEVEKMSEAELLDEVAKIRSNWVCSDLESLLIGKFNHSSLRFPWLIELLVSEKCSPAEIEALKRAIQYHGWAKIPIHFFEMLLGAKWEYDRIHGGAAPYHPNDEIDRKRAAVALSYADLFITEGDLAGLCQKAKVNQHQHRPTRVFSVRNPQMILKTVRSVIDEQENHSTSSAPSGLG